MIKKITKKQREAINYLTLDIDELMNKPRRLFSSLRKFAEAFREKGEDTNDILDSIDEFERGYYLFLNVPDIAEQLARNARKTLRELTSRNKFDNTYFAENDERAYAYWQGVEDAIKMLTTKNIKSIINEQN